jgi:RND family efflux transporter MFP subunit
MRKRRRIWLPIVIVIFGILLLIVLAKFKAKPKKQMKLVKTPLVRTQVFNSQTQTISLFGSGTVKPEKSVSVISQVSGEIKEVTDTMQEGAKFAEGDVLFKIDDEEYILRVKNAKALMLQQQMLYLTEKRNSDIAEFEWEEFTIKYPDAKPDSLTLRIPQLKLAEANYESAKASLELAELNLSRTEIKAPFDGIVMQRNTDEGQYVGPGTALGQIFGTEKAMITIPVKHEEQKWLTKGLDSEVKLSANVGEEEKIWFGKLVRKEASLDMKSRMSNLVVEIENPMNPKNPLPFGLFVNAEIEGKQFKNLYRIPRHLVRTDDIVLTISENKVVFNTVNVLKYEDDFALINKGLHGNANLIIGRLDIATPGMKVRTAKSEKDKLGETKDTEKK